MKNTILVIIITAIITTIFDHITGGLISSLWRFTWEKIQPSKLEVSITECMLYRTGFDKFPTCELNVIVNNATNRCITMELKRLAIFKKDIVYRFPSGEQLIKVEPNNRFVKRVSFRDKVLDAALKVPQDSSTAFLQLNYEYVGIESGDSVVLKNTNVIKCTYWQVPIFNNENEALATGAVPLWLDMNLYWTDKSGASHCDIQRKTIYTTETGLRDFEMPKPENLTMEKNPMKQPMLRLPLPFIISSAFRRKYGGVYFGNLSSESPSLIPFHYANEFFTKDGDYDQYSLIGTTYDRDFRDVLEFIYYTFDPAKQNEMFQSHQDNSKYYVLLVYENQDGILEISDSLKAWGYHTGYATVQGPVDFLTFLTLLSPKEKLLPFENSLKIYLDSLNSIIRTDGIFLFSPLFLDVTTTSRIEGDLRRASSKSTTATFTFDCRPFKSNLIGAMPFSTPVLALLNFSKKTRMITIDTTGIGQ